MELIRKALINSYTKVTRVTLSILMSNLTFFTAPDQPSMDYRRKLTRRNYGGSPFKYVWQAVTGYTLLLCAL